MAKFISKMIHLGSRHYAVRHVASSNDPHAVRVLLAAMNLRNYCSISSNRSCRITSQFTAACKKDTLGSARSLHKSSCLPSPASNYTATENTDNLITAWFNEVKAFGTITVHNIPFDVHIKPLNPVDYPDLNKSIVKLFYSSVGNHGNTEILEGRKLSELGKLCDLKVAVEDAGERVEVMCGVPRGVQLPLVCVITIPIKFDVKIKGSGTGSVSVNGLESDIIDVHLEDGDCHLSNLKTAKVTVVSEGGSIKSSRHLLGSIQMKCGKDGCIVGDRFQGDNIECITQAGDVDIKTIYAGKTTIASQSGNLHVRDLHGNVTVNSVEGNLTVGSFDGKLMAKLERGSADVFVTRQEGVSIFANTGDVTLRFSEDVSCSLDLDAHVTEKDESLKVTLDEKGKGFLQSETGCVVKATAPQGKISMKMQDWLSSINLQFSNDVV